MPTRVALGDCTLRVDVLNRITEESGTREVPFAIVSAASALPAPEPSNPDADEPEMTEPLSPEMEEGFALLAQRQYEQATRVFRKALGKEKTSARVARLFGVRPIPSTFVLDAEGIIRKRIVGYSSSFGFQLEEAIDKALKPPRPR